MAFADVAGPAEKPDRQQLSDVIMEIRGRWVKLDQVDEIVAAIKTMRRMVRL